VLAELRGVHRHLMGRAAGLAGLSYALWLCCLTSIWSSKVECFMCGD
jgi:hypothetical protein